MSANEAHDLTPLKSAWKTTLGVVGTLLGVGVVFAMLVYLLSVGLVKPSVAGGLTDQERYDLLSQVHADDQKMLTTYGWMDQSKGVVRLPIDVAMQKLVQEGWNGPQPAAAPAEGEGQQ